MFDRAVALFFAFVVLGLGVAAFSNAPLSFDGAFYFFRILDLREFVAPHNRFINLPLQAPILAAAPFTQNVGILRLIFSAAYVSVPACGLAVSWLICKSRRASLFIWPAMSICIAGLPGQFFFVSESIMAITLLWPALLVVLLDAPIACLPLVAITSVAAVVSHPAAVGPLAYIFLVAILSAIIRPQTRTASVRFACALAVLLVARVLMPLDKYETQALGVRDFVQAFHDSLSGWPLVAIAFTLLAALSCLRSAKSTGRPLLVLLLTLAGVSLVLWSSRSANWMLSLAYRSWAMPISILFMAAAAFEELWWSGREESYRRGARLYALPVIGTIFMVVLSIQSIEWGHMSRALARELVNSDRGCVVPNDLAWIDDTPLNNWAVPFYSVELQGRTPKTLLLPSALECRYFGLQGAVRLDRVNLSYLRRGGEGWFDLTDAQSRTIKQMK